MTERPVFNHEAMATSFQVVIAGKPAEYARQAAAAAFRELDRLESELSRYIETSDIARANRLPAGESIIIGEDTMQCLLAAAEISALTGRAFDPAYASDQPAAGPLYALDPFAHTLTALTARLHLDLGAVGKGYALDRMGGILREWDIGSACLQSGGSTVLALAAPPDAAGWAISVDEHTSHLANLAVSGSGLEVQGAHITDPRNQTTARRTRRTWSVAGTGAASDALSTAFFVMSDAEVGDFCGQHPEFGAILTQADGTLHRLGAAGALLS